MGPLLAAFGGALLVVIVVAVLNARAAAAREVRAAAVEAVARRYTLGDLSRPIPDYGDDDLGRVARAMDAAVQELGRRVNELARDRARMEAILSSMVEGVLVVDGQGRLQLVNEAARTFWYCLSRSMRSAGTTGTFSVAMAAGRNRSAGLASSAPKVWLISQEVRMVQSVSSTQTGRIEVDLGQWNCSNWLHDNH